MSMCNKCRGTGHLCESCRVVNNRANAKYRKTEKRRASFTRYNHSEKRRELGLFWFRSKQTKLRILENKP